jgi:two-component system sensor histidine kinase YesM
MILVYITFYTRISDEIENRETQNLNQSIDRVLSDISFIIDAAVNISNSIYLENDIYELLEEDYDTAGDYFGNYQDNLKDELERYATIYNNILNISVYSNNNSVISGGGFYHLNDEIKLEKWFLSDYMIRNGNYISGYRIRNSLDGQYSVCVSIRRKLNGFKQYSKYEKYIKLDINLQKFHEIFKREQIMEFILVDQEGQVLCSTSDKYPVSMGGEATYFSSTGEDLSEMILTRSFHKDNDWQIIGISKKIAILDHINEFGSFILILFLTSLLVSTLFTIIINRSYNYRIQKLSQHMNKIKNEKFELIKIKEGKDEIGFLITNFNLMTETINSLINNVLRHEILQKNYELESKQAELNFLQSQMNPHFLFNTLNALLVVCNKNHYDDVTEIIKYLSKTLRRLLSWDDVMVTVEEEVNFIEMYLKIEKFRFMDKFNYEIKVDQECMNYKIPKMSIQPLVENACEHGIQAIRGTGLVTICITKTEQSILVRIEDNGKGMTEDNVKELLHNIKKEKGNKNIGVRNVYRRLKLNYGEGIEFKIDSKINRGTIVSYMVPCQESEGLEEFHV